MNVNRIDEHVCRNTQRQIGAYIDNELLVETNLEVMHHLQRCNVCRDELELTRGLRARLRTAAREEASPPAYLATRIRANLRESKSRPFWAVWAPAAAAALCLVVGIAYQLGALRHKAGSQETYIASLSNRVASIMRVGLGDHVHCAVFRKYPKTPPPVEEVVSELDPKLRGIVPIAQRHVPKDFQLWMAHECRYHGRKFVHLTFRDRASIFSLVLARKADGESFATEGLLPSLVQSGIPLYEAGVQQYQIAAFETGDYLVYAVSDMPHKAHVNVMVALAPALQPFLKLS
jgi:hypothetical protein